MSRVSTPRARTGIVLVGVVSLLLLCAASASQVPLPARTLPEARQRVDELRAEIAHHDELYFKRASPEISDFAYDELKRELRELESAFPELEPTTGVAAGSDDRTGNFPPAHHREPMLSLTKAYNEADVRAFHRQLTARFGTDAVACVVEPKVDGIAISVTYEHGRLVRAVTRGNGSEGDDITANVLTIPSLPRELDASSPDGQANPIPEYVELRGEVYLTLAQFERINREREEAGDEPYANPRNLAAGSAKLLDPNQVKTRGLDIIFFGWGAWLPASTTPETQQAFRARARAWGLPVLEHAGTARTADELCAVLAAFELERRRLPYPTDGAVVKLDSVAQQRELGAAADAPKWALAFKFAPDRAVTRLVGITIQVGRTGVLTPVAELDPVSLGGSVIARASLHNREEIARLDLRLGDHVIVERAGEIIPAIVGIDESRRGADSQSFNFPTTCPVCDAGVIRRADEVSVRCPNQECPAQVRRRIEHFASAGAVAIDGLGASMIDVLVERGFVKDVAGLYQLRREDLNTLGRDVGRTTDNLLAAIERSKRAELWRVINGLGIPRVGPATARELAHAFGGLEALAAVRLEDFDPGGRAAGAGIGPAGARAIVDYFSEPQNRKCVQELLALGVRPAMPASAQLLAGKAFVLTGELPNLTRRQATGRIEAAGGMVRGSVSSRTDYVVAGANPGSKLTRARELGVPVIDEAGLLRLLVNDHQKADTD